MSEIADLDEANDPDHGPWADRRRKQLAAKDAEITRMREALAQARDAICSGLGTVRAVAKIDAALIGSPAADEQLQSALREAQIKARGGIQEEINDCYGGSPTPDPAEAMRATREAIAERYARQGWQGARFAALSGSPAPDLVARSYAEYSVEAMRAKCEEIARQPCGSDSAIETRDHIVRRIAALKGNGETK
jgi:hypothetical protein